MTDDPVRRAFQDHDAFEEDRPGYDMKTTAFEATATAEASDGEWDFSVTVRVPTLSAVTVEEVGPAVAKGWLETFELRLEDAYDVARTTDTDAPKVSTNDGTVRAVFGFWSSDPHRGVEDAAAVVEYVEGTYVQGVVPGYDYRDPVAGLLSRARETGQGGSGSTPL
jgi:hypothetical protein